MMAYDPEQRRAALREFLSDHGLSARSVCQAGGLSASALGQFLAARSRSLSDETYVQLAEGASKLLQWEVPPAMLRGEVPARVPVMDIAVSRESALGPAKPNAAQIGSTVFGWAPRLSSIQGRPRVFALYAPDDQMSPWREMHSLVYADRGRSPAIGEHAIVVFPPNPESLPGFHPFLLGKVTRKSSAGLSILQYRPGSQIDYANDEIWAIHRVIDWEELAFGKEGVDPVQRRTD